MTVTIYGASDDLIEVEGDIEAEFPLSDAEEGDVIALSDGTVLRVSLTRHGDGVWRVTPVLRGSGGLTIDLAPEGDGANYSDRATISGEVAWVVHGFNYATPAGGG